MTDLARKNGWRGFDGIGEKVDRGGWLYRCDGMPTLRGCAAELVVTRRLARVGTKKSGWLVRYGTDFPADGGAEDHDVVLTFCPSCAAVVRAQVSKVTA